MNCSKCDQPSEHAILVRLGKLPDSYDEKMKDKDKSGMYVFRFCKTHWKDVKKVFPTLFDAVHSG